MSEVIVNVVKSANVAYNVPPKWVRAKMALAIFGLRRSTLERWWREGRIGKAKDGNVADYNYADIDRNLEELRVVNRTINRYLKNLGK